VLLQVNESCVRLKCDKTMTPNKNGTSAHEPNGPRRSRPAANSPDTSAKLTRPKPTSFPLKLTKICNQPCPIRAQAHRNAIARPTIPSQAATAKQVNPAKCANLVVWFESVAQLVEHRPFKALVPGSSPGALTIINNLQPLQITPRRKTARGTTASNPAFLPSHSGSKLLTKKVPRNTAVYAGSSSRSIITSVDLMRAAAESPFFNRSSRTALAVIIAVR
jgi:hypothetical protein